MKDKFITKNGVEVPLHNVSYTFTEENPRFKDTFWTQYTLPIDYYYTRELTSNIGHFASHFATNLQRFHEGVHIFEGKRLKGKLEILEFDNEKMKIQIDSGFENLPNFDTKLEDLPLLDFEVPDIYAHAEEIVSKKFPEVSYNFPKLYTDKYNLEEEGWKYFDSMINNRVKTANGFEFPRNSVRDGTDVINKNIIHPLPYILYVLQVGFQDAGFSLEGDILADPHFTQRCIFSGKDYFTTEAQKEHKVRVYDTEYYDYYARNGSQYAHFRKSLKINAPGKYRLRVSIIVYRANADSVLSVYKNQSLLKEYTHDGSNTNLIKDDSLVIEITEEEAIKGAEILFAYNGIAVNNHTAEKGGVANFELLPIRQHTEDASPIPYVFNFNRVNLRRSVPDISFGELVTIVKNWRNYDLDFVGSRAIMNLIQIDKTKEPEDFRQFEVPNPLRKFTEKTYFNIKFPETENLEVKNIFIDDKGYQLNPVKIPPNTTEIEINAYCLPLINFRGQYTAKTADDTVLMLVHYAGLDKDGNNHATNPKGLQADECAIHLLPWYQNRLTNFTYRWRFITEKNKIRNINIRSEIFCYGRRHLIKSWVKQSISPSLYSIEMETETY